MESNGAGATTLPVSCAKLGVALSWDHIPGKQVDVDLQAVAFDDTGKLLDAVYYNNLKALSRGLTHSSDESTGEKEGYDELIWVDFKRLPPACKLIAFVVSAYSGGHLCDAHNGFFHLLENNKESEVAKFKLEHSEEEVDLVGALVRGNGSDWIYQVLELPAQDGKHFVDILEPTIGNFVRQVIPGAPKRIKACFAMEKGTVVDLPKTNEIKQVKVGLGWDTGNGNVDLDVSVVMFSADGRHLDTVFFGNLVAQGVSHSGDNLTGEGAGDDEVISFDLEHVPTSVHQAFMVVNIYTSGRTFSQVANPYCRVISLSGDEMCKYMLSDAGQQSGLIISRLFREPGDVRWGFQAIGVPCNGSTWKESLPCMLHYANVKATAFQMVHVNSMVGEPASAAYSSAPAASATVAVAPPAPAPKSSTCAVL
eukprot:TRINITY_DN46030_c0_g1_i1.p1 TRINITY_DN46030_c0_g1~~TRINITY_DN46030_c0_g1_i1.p1  ORF type:complete len:423 (-),score=83.23 TRINITY_DN46030_c0_g1_i1:28-1296(-)